MYGDKSTSSGDWVQAVGCCVCGGGGAKLDSSSTGSGKMIVEFFSAEICVRVCRYDDVMMTSQSVMTSHRVCR